MSDIRPIGITKGPGETPHEYLFITPDREQNAKSGEFVYYAANVDALNRRVLGRVTGRRPVRLLPNGFLADPDVPPGQVAALIGYTGHEHELMHIRRPDFECSFSQLDKMGVAPPWAPGATQGRILSWGEQTRWP